MSLFQQYRVIPSIPPDLEPLLEIAQNLWLTWNPDAVKLFLRMEADLWEQTHHNPVRMLGEISQQRLDDLSRDESFIMEVTRVREQLRNYLETARSLNGQKECPCSIAYFSAEFGLTDTIPIYSGGLGILSGDHVKSASDLNLNFRGVGLLYQHGYFQQYLNQDGWQQDFYQKNDFHNMPVHEIRDSEGHPVEIETPFPGRSLFLKAWRIEVGRVTIYMLDSNTDKNSIQDRHLTAQLYGGNHETRLQQEIILGIGGMRMLNQLKIPINVLHMNEGHSALAPFERARWLKEENGLKTHEALELVRKTSVFTTHTPVQAGHDEFPRDLVTLYLEPFATELEIPLEEFLTYGGINHDNKFSMTVAAVRNASHVNGVSKLHAEVSRKMWHYLWPETPREHVPIVALTNGIHIPSWISFEMNDLLERYLGVNWREKQDYLDSWEKVQIIPDPEIWNVHEIRRRRLIAFIRHRLRKQLEAKGASQLQINESQEALNPEALTVGFARRFASYKRGNLIFKDMDRLMNILTDQSRPIQLVFAGKAHPQDQGGKELIQKIINIRNKYNLQRQIAFIEDYDINVARYLVQGVDVWLNNPLRPKEACGTSGMKAACNGVLNFSVLDGWWEEAYDHHNGWAIGNGEVYEDRDYQDEVESRAIYALLENDIIPLFYTRGSDGLPREWIKTMKNSIISIASHYNTHRMVKQYFYSFYEKAHSAFTTMQADNFQALKDFKLWQEEIRKEFPAIRIRDLRFDNRRVYKINDRLEISVKLFLADLEPNDIRLDVYHGAIAAEEELASSAITRLEKVESDGNKNWVFSGEIPCLQTGNQGFRIRITPDHPLLVNPYEMNLVLWS